MKTALLASLMLMSAIGCANAQAVGVYNGTQANGTSVTLTVTTDPNNNAPEITSAGIGIAGSCGGSLTVSTGIGFGASQDIVNNKATVLFNGNQDYITIVSTFNPAHNTVSGTVTAFLPIFVPVQTGHPTKAAFCHTGVQKFTATLAGNAK